MSHLDTRPTPLPLWLRLTLGGLVLLGAALMEKAC